MEKLTRKDYCNLHHLCVSRLYAIESSLKKAKKQQNSCEIETLEKEYKEVSQFFKEASEIYDLECLNNRKDFETSELAFIKDVLEEWLTIG